MVDYSFSDYASAVPSGRYGGKGTDKPYVCVRTVYNDKGAYVMAYGGYDFLVPDKVLTLAGETPPADQVEFNDWMDTLRNGENGEKAITIGR